ncbi:hypothetical protein [Georgenia faecalis]|uniref:Yip1 domain-containing protein n=1 Tax=Georgenia faecalis TaxID=2483799 RepID=A0ABV9D8Q7_9MICO|nr:hypothetical protein [Georgenia faecalis]
MGDDVLEDEPAASEADRLLDRAVAFDRFSPAGRRSLLAGGVALFAVAFLGLAPALWHLLDTTVLLGAPAVHPPRAGEEAGAFPGVYTAAYLVSVAPAVGLVALVFGRLSRRPGARLPTPVLLAALALAVVQLAFVAAAWGDQFTGRALAESLVSSEVSLWGREPIERGWYVGYAGLCAIAAATAFAAGRTPRWRRLALLGALPAAVVLPWFLLSGAYVLGL